MYSCNSFIMYTLCPHWCVQILDDILLFTAILLASCTYMYLTRLPNVFFDIIDYRMRVEQPNTFFSVIYVTTCSSMSKLLIVETIHAESSLALSRQQEMSYEIQYSLIRHSTGTQCMVIM